MPSEGLGNLSATAKLFMKPFIYASFIYSKRFIYAEMLQQKTFWQNRSFFIYPICIKRMMKILTPACPLIGYPFQFFKSIVHLDLPLEFWRRIRKYITKVATPEQLDRFALQFPQHTPREQNHHPLLSYIQDISQQTPLLKYLPCIHHSVLWC